MHFSGMPRTDFLTGSDSSTGDLVNVFPDRLTDSLMTDKYMVQNYFNCPLFKLFINSHCWSPVFTSSYLRICLCL